MRGAETASPREVGHRSMALLRTAPFCEELVTTLSCASIPERDRFTKQELGQDTS